MFVTKNIEIAEGIHIGGESPFVLFAGPCVIESESMVLSHATKISRIASRLNIPLIFKASYDKANRTSGSSFRGPGLGEGLRILEKVKREVGLPIITDAHTVSEISAAGEVVDVIQIPAFLCRQTDLLEAAAKTGKPVNVKKGQFMAPDDAANMIGKVTACGNSRVMLTERGVTFGYHQLVVDFAGVVKMRESGWPVIFDATHSVQNPGGVSGITGGEGQYAKYLAWAAAAIGIDGLFIEAHENPSQAKSDAANMIPLADLEPILARFKSISEINITEKSL
ncbi:MAG: 3-deoxy-8-phosphooctulonate synthase [Calditrichaeota bacterium]|nr:3-deoxy-8-phosphooctulonate synthase [Calditrichota bacterium]MBT7618359.1 3-deoxy-8-phosphooctulonate synthase [Calditrichota bacterium]MBT7789024.1 3-deoxy-8-phosphooctulonate synthase [Calditrichota bacterium]